MTYEDITILDEPTLNEVKDAMGDKFPTMVNFFVEDTVKYVDQIKNGLNNDDIKEIIKGSHTIKSSCKQMGALRLSAIAEEIELKGRNIDEKNEGTIEDIKTLMTNLDEALEQTLPTIQKHNEE